MQNESPVRGDFIEVSLNQLIAINYTGRMHNKPNWKIVEEAIDDWLRKNAPGAVGEPEFLGYQWKGLFLPHGTVLRTAYNGKNVHCHVENDRIIYEGKALSPSGFVSAVGGIRRNAWKSIWLLLPDAKHWQLADHLRVRRRPPKARTRAHDARSRNASPAADQCVSGAAAVSPVPARASPAMAQQADPGPPEVREAPEPSRSDIARRAGPVPPAIAGWARKRRPQRLSAGSAHRLVALLRHNLLH